MPFPKRKHLGRNNALGDITGGVQVATTTADEVEVVVSADPGATGITYRLTFFGVQAA